MLSLLVYSGKGGVGKTTVTYCLYKALKAQGCNVVVLDMDLNTPSFHHLASNEDIISASRSMGLFIDEAQISAFLKDAKKKIKQAAPEVLLIDSPPSITHIHYAVMEKLDLSGVVLVTQPTVLSISDVEKTVPFFEQKGITVTGIVENMSNGKPQAYKYNKLASVLRVDELDSDLVYDENVAVFDDIAKQLLKMDLKETSLANRKRQMFDETITMETVRSLYSIVGDEDEGYYFGSGSKRDSAGAKQRGLKTVKFVNMRTWGELRDILLHIKEDFSDLLGAEPYTLKDVLTEASPEKVSRLLEAFEEDNKAMFMITRPLGLTVETLMGEIGTCILLVDDNHHGIPRVEYQTARGACTLFPHEVMPMSQEQIDDCLAYDGYTYIENGSRMLPPLELAQQMADMAYRVQTPPTRPRNKKPFDATAVTARWHRMMEGSVEDSITIA